MIAAFVITSLVAALPLVVSAQEAPASSPKPAGPACERRIFDIPSVRAWEVVQERLKDLGLSPERTDRKNRAFLTKWRDLSDKGMEWLPAPALPEGYTGKSVRFLVFVSPFAEPARVYVGSMTEASKMRSAAPSIAFNVGSANRSLMAQIAGALGQDGYPIPSDGEERRQLVLSLLGDAADDCVRQWPPPERGKITEPRKISLSEFKVLYPGPALEERADGLVKIEFTILEDGGVTDLRVLGAPHGRQLEASAMGAASLLLYAPTKLDGCPVPTIMTYTVNYRMR